MKVNRSYLMQSSFKSDQASSRWETFFTGPQVPSIVEPVESERLLRKPWRLESSICFLSIRRSSLSMCPKCLIILLTTSGGVQGGRVQGVMEEWPPCTRIGFPQTQSLNSTKNCEHMGQQRLETPITLGCFCFMTQKVRIDRSLIGENYTPPLHSICY